MIQKFIMMAVLLSLSAMRNVYGAEIQCTTKSSETQSLVLQDRSPKTSFAWQIAQLPAEVQANIWSKFFSETKEDDELNKQKFLSSSLSKGLGIKLFCRAKKNCPLRIRNKVFDWQDLIRLTGQERESLLRLNKIIKNRDDEVWARPYEKEVILTSLPTHIKNGLSGESSSFQCQGLQATEGFLAVAPVCPPLIYSLGACMNGCSASATCSNSVIHGLAWGSAGVFCFLAGACYLSEHLCHCSSSH